MIIIKVLRTNLIGITARTAQALTFESSPRYLVEKSKDFSTFFYIRRNGSYGNNRSYGNVAIKRGQRLLADYAEREQRKDCEAGLIMGV